MCLHRQQRSQVAERGAQNTRNRPCSRRSLSSAVNLPDRHAHRFHSAAPMAVVDFPLGLEGRGDEDALLAERDLISRDMLSARLGEILAVTASP